MLEERAGGRGGGKAGWRSGGRLREGKREEGGWGEEGMHND